MKTKIFDFREKINEEDLEYCADCLKAGNIGIFPTETVYGIGANALDKKAASLIFKAKNRAIDNPLIIHISNFNMLKDLVEEPNEIEKKLIDAFFSRTIYFNFKREENDCKRSKCWTKNGWNTDAQ